jgi:hypothetical protein
MPSFRKSLYDIKVHNNDIIDKIYLKNNKIKDQKNMSTRNFTKSFIHLER